MSDDFSSSGGSWGDSGGSVGDNDGPGGSTTEYSSDSWFGRIGKAIVGVPIGMIVVGVALWFLWSNEGNAVDSADALAEVARKVVSVPSDKVDPANEAKPIHTTGMLATNDLVKDDLFGVTAPNETIRLERTVRMYQWQEKKEEKTEKRVGGGTNTKTTYSYTKDWSDHPINSGQFHTAAGHQNPAWPEAFGSKDFIAEKVTLGAFILPRDMVHEVGGAQLLAVTDEDTKSLPDEAKKFHVEDGAFYRGKGNNSEPRIGDIKVTYKFTKAAPISVIAEQTQTTFRAFQPTTAKSPIRMLHDGNKSAAEMIHQAESTNNTMTWLVRLVGFLFVAVGIFLVFNPLVIIADFLPFLGSITGFVIGVFSLMLAFVLSFITIAIAWIAYRPLLAYALLGVAALAFVGAVMLILRARNRPKGISGRGNVRGANLRG